MNEIIVLKNVRRLMPKAWNKRTPNWVLVKEVFGCGATTALKRCFELKIESHAFEVVEKLDEETIARLEAIKVINDPVSECCNAPFDDDGYCMLCGADGFEE